MNVIVIKSNFQKKSRELVLLVPLANNYCQDLSIFFRKPKYKKIRISSIIVHYLYSNFLVLFIICYILLFIRHVEQYLIYQ